MAFEKAFENSYEELDPQTKYRFAEIEMGRAVLALARLHKFHYFPLQKAHNIIIEALVPNEEHTDQWKAEMQATLNSTYLTMPPKIELIQYLIIKGHSYKKIRDLSNASFNTISKLRYGVPQYYPRFTFWNPEMLQKWNDIKDTLNLFNEELAHTK